MKNLEIPDFLEEDDEQWFISSTFGLSKYEYNTRLSWMLATLLDSSQGVQSNGGQKNSIGPPEGGACVSRPPTASGFVQY